MSTFAFKCISPNLDCKKLKLVCRLIFTMAVLPRRTFLSFFAIFLLTYLEASSESASTATNHVILLPPAMKKEVFVSVQSVSMTKDEEQSDTGTSLQSTEKTTTSMDTSDTNADSTTPIQTVPVESNLIMIGNTRFLPSFQNEKFRFPVTRWRSALSEHTSNTRSELHSVYKRNRTVLGDISREKCERIVKGEDWR